MPAKRMTCSKCGRELKEGEFYKGKDGNRIDMCKDCITANIDNRRPSTFLWILEKFDVPYVEKKWVELANRQFLKNPAKFGPSSVLGMYLRTMRIMPYGNYCYADSDMLNAPKVKRKNESEIEELRRKVEAGEMSIEEFDARTSDKIASGAIIDKAAEKATSMEDLMPDTDDIRGSIDKAEKMGFDVSHAREEMRKFDLKHDSLQDLLDKVNAPDPPAKQDPPPKEEPDPEPVEPEHEEEPAAELAEPDPAQEPEGEDVQEDEEILDIGQVNGVQASQTLNVMGSMMADQDAYYQDNLDEEDLKYLFTKWGAAYRPSQLVAMEKMYQEYERENELNADRADALRKICRTSVKMDEAMEAEDYHSYKNLSQVYDQLRKSARFTDSQKKEDDSREIDSIGELVAFVEREGGAIPLYEDPIDYPKDKIDFIVRDMQNYISNVVRGELGLGDLIEQFVEELRNNKTQSVEDIMASPLRGEDIIEQADSEAFHDFLLEEAEKDAYLLMGKDDDEGGGSK